MGWLYITISTLCCQGLVSQGWREESARPCARSTTYKISDSSVPVTTASLSLLDWQSISNEVCNSSRRRRIQVRQNYDDVTWRGADLQRRRPSRAPGGRGAPGGAARRCEEGRPGRGDPGRDQGPGLRGGGGRRRLSSSRFCSLVCSWSRSDSMSSRIRASATACKAREPQHSAGPPDVETSGYANKASPRLSTTIAANRAN